MNDKKTKAELMAMLAEAVRNTQPQPILAEQPASPMRASQPETARKKALPKKRGAKLKSGRTAASRKKSRR